MNGLEVLRVLRRGPNARRRSGSPTGPGSIFTHWEQHYRADGRTSGKKQRHRFPRGFGKA